MTAYKWTLLTALSLVLVVPSSYAETDLFRVVGVSDGDTITVVDEKNNQHKVRLASIDAPEKSQPFGERSKQSLSELVMGKEVILLTKKRDRYGRQVSQVLTDGLIANLEQVRRGLAWHYTEYGREQSEAERARYLAAQFEARTLGKGIWQEPDPLPPWVYRRKSRTRQEKY